MLLLVLLYYCCLDSWLLCDTLLPWTLDHPDHLGIWGPQGAPFPMSLLWSGGCPTPPPLLLAVPLGLSGFAICLVRSPQSRQGCPWGQAGCLPLVIRLLVAVSESAFEASFSPFSSPGREFASQGCGHGFQTDGGSPGAPQRAAATCLLLARLVLSSY